MTTNINSNTPTSASSLVSNNGNHPNHLPRKEKVVVAGNARVKVSVVEKRLSIYTYTIGIEKEDRETGRKFLAPYVPHKDMPEVIAKLQEEYAANEAKLQGIRAEMERERAEEVARADSWKTDKGSKSLRLLHKKGVDAVKASQKPTPRVDSSKESTKNQQVFAASLERTAAASGEGQ